MEQLIILLIEIQFVDMLVLLEMFVQDVDVRNLIVYQLKELMNINVIVS